MKKQIAVFASGTGTNFEAIARACKEGVIDADVAVLVCDVPGAPVIKKAELLGIDTFVFSPKQYASKASYEYEILQFMKNFDIQLVCLAGYMRIVGDVLLGAYEGKIINIHPSLLPAFKGAFAVERAVAYGCKVYGISIHYVNKDLDGGQIIAQKAFEYDGHDSAEVHRLGQVIEHQLYIDVIKKLLA